MEDPTRNITTLSIENLTIGVFAIVMTLLVLDIKVPKVPANEMFSALLGLWPNLLAYAISFALLGIYFMGYFAQFQYIIKADQNSHWISFLFLSLVALLPFSTALLSANPDLFIALAIYGSNLILIGLALYWHWIYAIGNNLVKKETSKFIIRYAVLRCITAPFFYVFAIIIALLNPGISLIIFAIIPLLYIIPGMKDIFWFPLANRGIKNE